MEISKIISIIENFAPLELQEAWDNSGFQIDFGVNDVKKVLLCLSVTENVINQAVEGGYDLIIAHHPLFFIPFRFQKDITIYSAHTNLDVAKGGTTDTLIEVLGLNKPEILEEEINYENFPRLVVLKDSISLDDFAKTLKSKLNLKTLHVVNNNKHKTIKRIAFCAGSGICFAQDAKNAGADVFVTGDVKYHAAIESDVIIMDVGHFEGERPVLTTIKKLLEQLEIEVKIADEESPFIIY